MHYWNAQEWKQSNHSTAISFSTFQREQSYAQYRIPTKEQLPHGADSRYLGDLTESLISEPRIAEHQGAKLQVESISSARTAAKSCLGLNNR